MSLIFKKLINVKLSKLISIVLSVIVFIFIIKEFYRNSSTVTSRSQIEHSVTEILKTHSDYDEKEKLSWLLTKQVQTNTKTNHSTNQNQLKIVTIQNDDSQNTKPIWKIPRPKIHENIQLKTQPKFSSKECKSDMIIILCMSTAENVAYRNVIRETWANQQTGIINFKLVFVIARTDQHSTNLNKEIAEESVVNNDLLIADFTESRYEYTRKFIGATNWLVNEVKCNKIRFILRVLDDVYVNLPIVLKWINRKYPKTAHHIYLGNIIHQDEPIRDQLHPLYTSEEDYPNKYFPDYIRSPVYLFSLDTIICLHSKINSVIILPMEDAYIGLLAKKCNIHPIHNEHFVLLSMPDNICHHQRMFFMGHMKAIDELTVFHNLKSTSNKECEEIEQTDDEL